MSGPRKGKNIRGSWQLLHDHEDLEKELDAIRPEDLRCIRMMGTFIAAAGTVESPRAARGEKTPKLGLVSQTARLILTHWRSVQSLLLIGSSNTAIPVSQAPYSNYTYLFVARLVSHLLKELGKNASPPKHEGTGPRYDQLVIRFTFVPEDILFAQFFYDDQYLVVASTYSLRTYNELGVAPEQRKRTAYAAVFLDNKKKQARGRLKSMPGRRFPETSRRLLEIFDSRFRELETALGQEIWTVKRFSDQDWGVLVETPFWRPSSSVLRAFDFGRHDSTETIELGPNGLNQFSEQIESQIGPSPIVSGLDEGDGGPPESP